MYYSDAKDSAGLQTLLWEKARLESEFRAFCGSALKSSSRWLIPIVSIVVPFFGLTNSTYRILKGSPKKELQWRL